ncbi:hypothetical protein KM176_20335 [Pseudooceanicola sp. CBS1P-1]|uniref:Acyl-CoA dehydrogenase/oxidase C-terminal domain-containing protein n=1 Tax=Pseudooceanicola albus TaxID=2692189 RepID=A0A6L7GAD6_9RHOB|nr:MULTISPECIES: hypothetical protein [Pseudooceanicola]MBT9386230.1 hypothetical protein [Pseudooceanicola endophyticus]MXN20280.1 hypothetical protein [Pseudooceanicola albus]
MLDIARASSLAGAVLAMARAAGPAPALELACEGLSGCPGYLAPGRHALHALDAALVDPACPDQPPAILRTATDPALAAFGLRLSELAPCPPLAPLPECAQLALALRLGLLARILDLAFRHLETREIFGQRATHLQLIKARFSAGGAFLARMETELSLGPVAAPGLLHDEIDRHTIQAAKLMGGHGYLEGSLHGLEYCSQMIRAVYGAPVPEHPA